MNVALHRPHVFNDVRGPPSATKFLRRNETTRWAIPLIVTALRLQVCTDSHERSELRSVTSGLAETVGRQEPVEHVVAPVLADAQVVAQQAFLAEPELLEKLA